MSFTLDAGIVVVAVLALFGSNTMSTIVGRWLAQRDAAKLLKATEQVAQRALAASTAAEIATAKAEANAAAARKQAADAISAAINAARSTNGRLDEIKRVAESTNEVAQATRKIVDGSRSSMLRLVAELRQRISAQNPEDEAAKEAAATALRLADEAEADLNRATSNGPSDVK